jgi:hypothetical protein
MVEAVVGYLTLVGTVVTWVMSTATLAVSGVMLYLLSQGKRRKNDRTHEH